MGEWISEFPFARSWIFLMWVSAAGLTGGGALQAVASPRPGSLECERRSPEAFPPYCVVNGSGCSTFVLLYANSYYPSLSKLCLDFGFDRAGIAAASGLPNEADRLTRNQPLLIPVKCRCQGGHYEALVMKKAVKGETLQNITDSLEGLTACGAIRRQIRSRSWGRLSHRVPVPLACACPTPGQSSQGTRALISYPVVQGDTLTSLASIFNCTVNALASGNNISASPRSDTLVVGSSILIPVRGKPDVRPLLRAREAVTVPAVGVYNNEPKFPTRNASPRGHGKQNRHMLVVLVGTGAAIIATGTAVAIISWVTCRRRRRKRANACQKEEAEFSVRSRRAINGEVEIQEESINGPRSLPYTPRKEGLDVFTSEELRRGTEEFSPSNFIDGTVYHGRLNGKSVAIKQIDPEMMSKVEHHILNENHSHPNIGRLLGTCIEDGGDCFLIFEYAKNGSLKDWLHGGLAMKTQFIASCYCFLSWNQRLKICLNVATGLHYMHRIMTPSYVHRNIKSRNILLDEDFRGKIGNFGLATCSNDDQVDLQMSWSAGYLAPEYVKRGFATPSTDIFAYGVVLLEVLSGRTPLSRPDKAAKPIRLSDQIKSVVERDDEAKLRGFMDPALGDAYSIEAARVVARLAAACVDKDPSLRPSAAVLSDKFARLVEELPGEDVH